MPRRRMIDPSLTDDTEVAKLDIYERWFLVGCLRNADDEGRLMGNPAFLKAGIFMYDDEIDLPGMKKIRDSTLDKMSQWRPENMWHIKLYTVYGVDYLFFPHWRQMEKVDKPTPSKLPAPPESLTEPLAKPLTEHISEQVAEQVAEKVTELLPSQSRSGQSSQGKVSIGQVRSGEVSEDFTEFLKSENDLTDFLTKTLKKYMSAGREQARQGPEATPERERGVAAQWGMLVIEKFWTQATGSKLSGLVWQGAYSALQKYPVDIMALAFVKAGPYGGGKHKSWKYIQTIINEEMEKRGRSPPN